MKLDPHFYLHVKMGVYNSRLSLHITDFDLLRRVRAFGFRILFYVKMIFTFTEISDQLFFRRRSTTFWGFLRLTALIPLKNNPFEKTSLSYAKLEQVKANIR